MKPLLQLTCSLAGSLILIGCQPSGETYSGGPRTSEQVLVQYNQAQLDVASAGVPNETWTASQIANLEAKLNTVELLYGELQNFRAQNDSNSTNVPDPRRDIANKRAQITIAKQRLARQDATKQTFQRKYAVCLNDLSTNMSDLVSAGSPDRNNALHNKLLLQAHKRVIASYERLVNLKSEFNQLPESEALNVYDRQLSEARNNLTVVKRIIRDDGESIARN
jgi:hypothetical protein